MRVSTPFKLALGIVAAILALCVTGFFVWVRLETVADRLTRFVPASALAYVRAEGGNSTELLAAYADAFVPPEMGAVLNQGRRWGIASVAYARGSKMNLGNLYIMEFDGTDAEQPRRALTKLGYLTSSSVNRLTNRAIVTATDSEEVAEQAKGVRERTIPSLADDPRAVFALKRARAWPASILIHAGVVASKAASFTDTRAGVLATALREELGRDIIFGLAAADGRLVAATPEAVVRLEPMTPPPAVFMGRVSNVGDEAIVAANLLRSDTALQPRFDAWIEKIRLRTGIDLLRLAALLQVPARFSFMGPDEFAVALSPTIDVQTIAEIIRSLVAGLYPMKKPFILRDGTTGFEEGRRTDVTIETTEAQTIVSDGEGHKFSITPTTDGGIRISSGSVGVRDFKGNCQIYSSENEFIIAKISEKIVEAHRNNDQYLLCIYNSVDKPVEK